MIEFLYGPRQDVAPGESLEVKMTYKLNDLTTPVEIKGNTD